MTIASGTPRKAYQTDGVSRSFPIPFPFQDAAGIGAILTDANGNDTVLRPTTDFSVTLTPAGIMTSAAYAAGNTLTIYLDVPIEQQTIYVPNDPFPAKSHERALDKLTLIAQVLADRFSRTFMAPIGEAGSAGLQLPARGSRKGKLLGFDPVTGDAKVVDGSDFKGDPGPAGNVAGDLAQLKAAATTNIAMIFAGALFVFQPGDYSAKVDDVTYVQSALVAPNVGAWVRRATVDGAPVLASTYGVSALGTPAGNLAGLKKAIAATPAGGTLKIPFDATFDVTNGLNAAALIDRPMTVQIDGRLQTNGHAVSTTANPCYLFHVTSPHVRFTGGGTLAGDGTTNDANINPNTGSSYTIDEMPGLIYVDAAAYRFTLDSLTIDTPPKAAITLAGCNGATIDRVTWTGGPANYGGTAYFGIVATGGGFHTFSNMTTDAVAGPDNPKFTNLIFCGGKLGDPTHCTVALNRKIVVWEKIFYGHGSDHLVIDNDGTGDHTDFIRLIGDRNKAYRNTCNGGNGLISAYDGAGIELCDNTGTNLKQIGIYVDSFPVTAPTLPYAGKFDGLKIERNTLIGATGSLELTDGIRVNVASATSTDISIDNNRVVNFCLGDTDALIRVMAQAPYSIVNVSVTRNRLADTTKSGIVLNRCIDSQVESNRGRNIGLAFLNQIASGDIRWLNNTGKLIGIIGINGLDVTSEGHGNRYTDAPLNGTFMLAASINMTIDHGGVAPNARITIEPNNNAFGTLCAVKGYPRTAPSVTPGKFDVFMVNGTAAAGTEQGRYFIDQ